MIVPTIDANGITVPSYEEILTDLQTKYRGIYGEDIYLGNDSQDGQFLGVLASAYNDCNAVTVAVYNSFSPATAQGNGLSSNVKINGLRRKIPTNSTADVLIVGQVGTTIVNGIVADVNNNQWLLPASVVIPVEGEITVTATAREKGAISAAIDTITTIVTPVFGWQSVTNESIATEGNPVETDAELRVRQSTSTALPSLTVLEGTVGAVANIEGVTRYKGYENDSGTTDGDGIPAHSIAIVVEGGDSTEIATAIAEKKTPGTPTYGTTSIVVLDRYGVPNTINFYRPTDVTIGVKVSITAVFGYTTAYADLIKQAVVDSINALGIGDDVIVTRLYVPANLPGQAAGSTFEITALEVKKNAGSYGTSNIAIAFNEVAMSALLNIEVIVT